MEVDAQGTRRWYAVIDGHRVLHRTNGPAFISGANSPRPHTVSYHRNAQLHRINGPASTLDYGQGTIYSYWYVNGLMHRDGGPAFESFVDGLLYRHDYYYQGILHRIGGPAIEIFNPTRLFYYINNEPFNVGAYRKLMENIYGKNSRQYKGVR